jgi:hypothetical protein
MSDTENCAGPFRFRYKQVLLHHDVKSTVTDGWMSYEQQPWMLNADNSASVNSVIRLHESKSYDYRILDDSGVLLYI